MEEDFINLKEEVSIFEEKYIFISFGNTIIEIIFKDFKEEDLFVLEQVFKDFNQIDTKETKNESDYKRLYQLSKMIKKLILDNVYSHFKKCPKENFDLSKEALKRFNAENKNKIDYNKMLKQDGAYGLFELVATKVAREDIKNYWEIFVEDYNLREILEKESFFWTNVAFVLINKLKIYAIDLVKKSQSS